MNSLHPPSIGQENAQTPNLQKETRSHSVEWHACTLHEIEKAIFQAGNTSAGQDGNSSFSH